MKINTFFRKLRSVSRYSLSSPRAGIPLEILLILTDECNYRCRLCSLWSGIYKDKKKSPLSLQEIKRLVDDAAALGVPTFILSGGEPLLRQDIVEIVEYTSRRIENVRLNTNASLMSGALADSLVRSGIKEVWISLDGIGDYYNTFRGVKDAYEKTTKGILELCEAKRKSGRKSPRILIDTIVSHDNVFQIPELISLIKRYDVDELTLTHTWYIPQAAVKQTEETLGMQSIYSGQFSAPLAAKHTSARLSTEAVKSIQRAAQEHGLSVFIDPLLKQSPDAVKSKCKCLSPWTNMQIFHWGDLCVCPILDKVIVGNVREKPLMELWNSPKMKEIRNHAVRGFEVCRHCILYRRTLSDHLFHPQTIQRILFS